MSKFPGGIIYKATLKKDGRCYIGLTTKTLNKRKAEHIEAALFKKSPLYFHCVLRQYGPDNFNWEIITTRKTKKGLANAEIRYIEKFAAFEKGFNATTGGELGEK